MSSFPVSLSQLAAASSSQAPRKKTLPLVYNTSEYGAQLVVPLVDGRLSSVTTFTPSAAATVFRTTTASFTPSGSGAATTYTPLLHSLDTVLSDLDQCIVANEGNKTAFDQDYLIQADVAAAVRQIEVSAAFALNVTTWVDGAAILNYVQFTLSSYQAPGNPFLQEYITVFRPSSVYTALGANGTHLLIVRATIDVPFEIKERAPILLNISINTSGTSTNDTWSVGLVDTFPVYQTTAPKRIFPSQLILHLHPLPEEIDDINGLSDYELQGSGRKKN